MMKHLNPAIFPAKVAARINEFRVARSLSIEQLTTAANLSPAEVIAIHENHEKVTLDLVERVANAFNVHPAVLLMCPDEDPIAQLLEPYRDLPREEFQRVAGELVSRGYQLSCGSA